MNESSNAAVQDQGHAVTEPRQPADCENATTFQLLTDDITERDLSGVLQLPDIEDTAMAHVFAYIEHYQEDLFWSLLSDSFFTIGGSIYVIVSLWDYFGYPRTACYKALMLIAPLLYLINSVIDIVWANRVRRRTKVRSSMKKLWEESMQTSGNIVNPKTWANADGNPAVQSINLESCWTKVTTLCNKMRRHAAHRRTVFAALTFGAAALVGFVAVLIDYSGGKQALAILYGHVSIHLYVASAVIAVSGKRTRPWLAHSSCVDNHENLEDLGDLFFLFGSVVDAALCDSPFNDHAASWAIVSSLFWLTDACFYLLSDFVMAYKFIRQSGHPGTLDGKSHSFI
jgi:hypothetical protein